MWRPVLVLLVTCSWLGLPLSTALPISAQAPPAGKVPEGFVSLFNGTNLDGWRATGKAEVWAAEDGKLVCKGGGGGYLLTDKEYGDFEFRCQYRWAREGGNSGVGLRTPLKGDPAYVGMEIQLIDDENWAKIHKSKLAPYQHTGSIYAVQPATTQNNKAIGEWNDLRIVCQGRKVRVELNGKELVDANLDSFKNKFASHPGLLREKGHLGFQSYNVRVEFRNITIKELPR